MTVSHASRYFAPLALAASLLALPLCVSANSITFTNTGDASASPVVPPLSIELSSDILVNSQGNFSTTCLKAAPGDPYCAGIQTGGPSGDKPVLSFDVSRTAVDLAESNKSVTLSWSSNPAAEVCSASGNTAAAGQNWVGPKSSVSPVTVTYSSVGTYEYTLACFNEFGKSQSITRSVTVTSTVPPLPADGCKVIKSQIVDPAQRALFQPEGFVESPVAWSGLFTPGSVYPSPISASVYPVGSYTLAGNKYSPAVTTRGKYITVPIVGSGNNYKFEWIQAKPSAQYNYAPNRPTDFKYVTLSTCRGDFRTTSFYTAVDPVNDPSLIQQCRNRLIDEAGLYYGPTGFGRCPVKAGETWYLNIVFANPEGGLLPSETGCRDSVGGVCDTSWLHAHD